MLGRERHKTAGRTNHNKRIKKQRRGKVIKTADGNWTGWEREVIDCP